MRILAIRSPLVATIAVCCLLLLLLLLLLPPLSSPEDQPRNEDHHRRRLAFFDPKTVEYKHGALKPKDVAITAVNDEEEQKSGPLFKEDASSSTTSSQKYKKKASTTKSKSTTKTKSKTTTKKKKTTAPKAASTIPKVKKALVASSSETTTTKSAAAVVEPASSRPLTVSPNPSYLQLCEELLHRTEGGGSKDEHFVVHESPEVCASQDSYAALAVVMLSATIAQAGSKVRLVYQHNCKNLSNTDFSQATIQQSLPPDVTLGVGIGQKPIAEKCSKCIKQRQENGRDMMVECMGIPNAGAVAEPIDPMTISFRMAGFRHNVQQAVQDIRKAEIAAGLPSPTYGGAVIVLDLDSEVSGRAWALPLYYYEELLPKSVSSIAILVTQRCINTIALCQTHGQLLAKGLQQLYPDAVLHGEILPSTATAYARIMDAPQLICPPTMFCLLPAVYSEYSKASYHVMNNNLYEWFKFVARENRKLMGKQLIVVEPDEIKPKPLVDLKQLEAVLNRERPNNVRRRRLSLVSDPKSVVYKTEKLMLITQAPKMFKNPENDVSSKQQQQPAATYSMDDSTTVPSYVQLCQELLERNNRKGTAVQQFVVHESTHVCESQDSFQSLVTMMISSIVAHAGSFLRLSYQHNCSITSSPNIKTATIQQLLPSTLSISKGIGLEATLARCTACTLQIRSTLESIECFGFPIPGPMASTPTGAAHMIPHFRHNVEASVNKARLLEAGNRPPTNAGVVIYLDTDTEIGTDVYQPPMKYYAEIIPRDISSISIVISDRCTNCGDLSAFTMEYLHLMYPTAKVAIESVSGSAIAYARVMEAPINICSPSLFCVLPALFKEFSHKSHFIMHPAVYPWFRALTKESGNKLNTSIFFHDDQDVRPVGHLNDMKQFLFEQVEPTAAECANLRGRLGEWTYDLEYAEFAQYVTPLKRFREFDFTPTTEQPYRQATSYRWVDALCPVYVMERDHLCSTMISLGLARIYIVGDSLSLQMAQSLWKMLGHKDDPFKATTKTTRFHWSRSVECPTQQRGFEIVYTRNDLLDNNNDMGLQDRIGLNDFNCGFSEFCMPWIKSFADYKKGGTLLIANVGSHVHDIDLYRKYLDDFLSLMDNYQKPKDVVMVRTTVPGHEHCQNPDVAPLRNYDEYLEKYFIADFKSYQLFPMYNRMLEERIRQRDKATLQVLDVTPMTVLRPDGHISGQQKCTTCKDKDCIHYMLPGPPDWWNNLMYSNLASMMASSQKSSEA